MRLLIFGEYHPELKDWFFEDKAVTGMPAVYNFYRYLGQSEDHQFKAIIYNPVGQRKISLPNGSVLELRQFRFPFYLIWKVCVLGMQKINGFKHLKNGQFDLVYGMGSFAAIASLCGRWMKHPSAGRIFGTILTRMVEKGEWARLYSRHWMEIFSYKIPPNILIGTRDGSKLDMVARTFNGRVPMYLLYNGIDRDFKKALLSLPPVDKLPETSDILRIVYVARLEPYKRQALAIAMVRHLVFELGDPTVELQILGAGSQEKPLKELVRSNQLEKQVTFHSPMAQRALPEFLRKAHLSCFFYRDGSLGNAFWESCLAGRFILATDTGDTSSIVQSGSTGLILADGKDFPARMAEAIKELRGVSVLKQTTRMRQTVDGHILPWKERFDREMTLLTQQLQ